MTDFATYQQRSYKQGCKAWLKKRILSTFAMVIKTYNVQLFENLMYLGLHPPKHGKLHSCENICSMSICHFHIGQAIFLSPSPNPTHMRNLFLMDRGNKKHLIT
jgi:hypothetical protein